MSSSRQGRVWVLCLSLALIFMAIAVPADANSFAQSEELLDPNSSNRFCVGKTIDYAMFVGNLVVPGNEDVIMNVYDTYPNGTVELLEKGLLTCWKA